MVSRATLDTMYDVLVMDRMDPRPHRNRSLWATFFFLLAFAVLIVVIARWFLIPAMQAANQADAGQRQHLSAYSLLLLAVTLLILICGLVLTFRVSRFFFPSQSPDRTKTKHVDAWAESARRFKDKEP